MYGFIRIPLQFASNLSEQEVKIVSAMIESSALAIEKIKIAEENFRSKERSEQEHERSNILRSISHDLRTPLAGIMGTSDMIMDMTQNEEMIFSLAKGIHEDAEWLYALVENVLSLTKILDGKLAIKKEYEAVEEVLDFAIRSIEKKAGNRTIELEIPTEVIVVPMNARLIGQVLINLLDNAIKHTLDHDEIIVRVQKTEDNEFAEFTVMDSGTGIQNQDLENVFQMFFTTSDDKTDQRRGIGLGLAICQSIINAHGGTISASNRTDKNGAIFKFTLPLKECDGDGNKE
ncbi:TPA: ATP-binding protein [Streptococcus suis]|nr:ATP-binding protein [Streptococcus suis]